MTKQVIVCDTGSGYLKLGYAGQDRPAQIIPSLIGRPHLNSSKIDDNKPYKSLSFKERYVGQEAAEMGRALDLTYPVEAGVIKNWTDMESLWKYSFDLLNITDPSNTKILLTEAPMNPKKNREQMVQTMLEKFEFGHVYVAIQAVLTLYAQGLQTGLVVDSGDGVTHIVPIWQGYELSHLTKRMDLAGRDVTAYLMKLLKARGYQFTQVADYEVVREIKEKYCFVAHDLEFCRKLARETTSLLYKHELPRMSVKLEAERFEAPEILFTPHLVGNEQPGIDTQVFSVINSADWDTRPDLYRHIILSGGTTAFAGFPTRLEQSLVQKYSTMTKDNVEGKKKVKIRVQETPNRKHAVWAGGSVLAEIMAENEQAWVSKAEWQEQGPRCLSKIK